MTSHNPSPGRRRGSTVTSVSSSIQQHDDPIAELSNDNAISTLLQQPIIRTGLPSNAATYTTGHKAPSSRDIVPVTLTNIPHIEPSAFTPYLKQAGSLYEAFQRAKEETGDGPRRPQKGSGSSPRRGPLPVAPLSTIPNVYFDPDFHLENPRTFDIVSERSGIVQPPGPNGAPVTPGSGGRRALATNAILQEKLSWYMDTVEVHLISSISTASTSFFAALGSLRELHQEASTSVSKIKRLREDLSSLDRNMALGGLKIVAMRRRKENMQKLSNAVQQLRSVTDAVAQCEEQVDKGEIEEALLGLAAVEKLIAGEISRPPESKAKISELPSTQLIDLRNVKALEGAGNDIAYLRQRIGKSFESRFLEALLADIRKHVDTVSSNTTFQRWDNASQRSRGTQARAPNTYPAYLQLDDSLRAVLQANLEGLAKSDSIKPATTAYREAVWKEVKSLIRRHLPSSSDDDTESTMSASTQGGRRMTQQEKSSVLARNLRDLDSVDAEQMLRKIYSNVGEALRRLGTQVKVVLDITSTFSAGPPRNPKSPMSPSANPIDSFMAGAPDPALAHGSVQQEDIQQTLDMSNLLGQAVDIAQAQITKVLKVRSEQSTRLPLPAFLRYFHLNRLFADECEAVSGRGGVALKTVVNTHIKEFIHHAGDTERQRLIQGMDSDHWDAKDFSDADSETLTRIIEASTRDVEAWTHASTIWAYTSSAPNGDSHVNGTTPNGASTKDPKDRIRSATIDEQKFILPSSSLIALNGISQFEQIIAGIPGMTAEVTSILLDYLKLFNSRSSQLILGAGATRSAGLKNITTKHLALASQALSFVTALTPYVREFVRRQSYGSGNLMMEFDKVKRLYQEHQAGINDKLVDIMSGRATTHVNVMKKIDWDAGGSEQGVNPYVETLVKETTTLHKVLSKHLPEVTVQMIMGPVFASYRDQWGKAFAEKGLRTVAGKERYVACFLALKLMTFPYIVVDIADTHRMLRDAEFFRSRLSKLDGAGDIGDYVVSIVNAKTVAEQTGAKPASPSNGALPPSAPAGGQKQENGNADESKS